MTNAKAVEQVEMISLREITVSSLAGHTVHFEAGVARDVPAFLVAEAMAKGCMPTDQVNLPSESVSGRKATDFVGALRDQMLVRLKLDGEKVIKEERLLKGAFGRIRDVRAGPDGLIYLLTDDTDGKLIRLEPAG